MTPHDPFDGPTNVRNDAVRFDAGSKGTPPGPFARRVAALRQVLYEAASGEAFRDAIDSLIERAKKGDVAAAKLVLHYALGKPHEAVDPDAIEREEHRSRQPSVLSFENRPPRAGARKKRKWGPGNN